MKTRSAGPAYESEDEIPEEVSSATRHRVPPAQRETKDKGVVQQKRPAKDRRKAGNDPASPNSETADEITNTLRGQDSTGGGCPHARLMSPKRLASSEGKVCRFAKGHWVPLGHWVKH